MGRAGTVAEAFRAGALPSVQAVHVVRGRKLRWLPPEEVKPDQGVLHFELAPQQGMGPELRARVKRSLAKRRGTGPGLPGALWADRRRQSAAELIADALQEADLFAPEDETVEDINDGTEAAAAAATQGTLAYDVGVALHALDPTSAVTDLKGQTLVHPRTLDPTVRCRACTARVLPP